MWKRLAILGAVIPILLISAQFVQATPRTPSFSFAPGTPLQGPGCPVTGTWSDFVGPDGTHYAHISQINVIPASPTPCPGFETPTPSPNPTASPIPTPVPTPTPTPAPVVTVVDDESLTYFGTWTAYAKSASFIKYGIGDHASTAVGSAVGLIFTGTEVRLFGAIAPYHGIASVAVDGAAPVDVDLYSPTRVDQAPLFYSGPLTAGVHRITMTVTGRKNAASSNVIVAVDRVDITDGSIVPPLVP